MTIVKHELRQGRGAFLVWTLSIAALLMVCIFLFPDIEKEMAAVGDVFASMGAFAAAFGMDRLDMGTMTGFYAIECGNVMGLGGAFFAASVGVSALAKEEKGRTAEFLLTHPVSRARILSGKLAAIAVEILAMELIVMGLAILSMVAIGEEIPWREILLLHLAYLLLQVELAGICFGISAALRTGGVGLGLGLAAAMYCLNLIANLTERASALKYVTPFGYCEGADIVSSGKLAAGPLAAGMALAAAGIAAAYIYYGKKDIR